jgi:hypothetical protein
MKKLGIALIMILLIAAVPDDIMAGTQDRLRDGSCRDKPTTGAPLDGGLLTILGAAGIAYYVSRKKKAKAE